MTGTQFEAWPLTTEQREIVKLCRDFAEKEIRPRGREVDEADVVTPVDIFAKAAQVGITDFMIAEEFGGGGMTDVFTQCLVQEELCWGDPGIGNLVCSNGFFSDPLMALGTPEQKEKWLRPLTGTAPLMTALATTEPGSGSDAASIITTATRVDGGYRINGQKAWISNAGAADQYVVFAKTDRNERSKGVTAFMLTKDTPGLTWGEPMKKMGQRAIVCRELFFDDVFVPEENRLGDEGQGFYGLMETFDISRIVLGAAAVGAARAAYEYALDYARTRKQFGKPIIEHQAVAFRLADMATRIGASRLLVHHAARSIDAGVNTTGLAAMAKLTASETAMFVTHAAVQTLGGWGYSREYPVEQWMRDVKLEEIEEGTSDIMRLVISRNL
ncbi:acyl-CoA dehydrogenase [Rhodococcus sp. OK611]|uniref:acyl-CoA dehydrogenase family protein n=1 Tax=unclassified Rhodococcus (in: high G+C Gram-positive bacteria) TaxID=192944 RepID=UPI000BDD1A4E|nr:MULTISPECIES: acyl-CoA dehydrogenase family protein [unclassified Rhodococcus (in: high G+C Gram-positive bacteria)]PTR41134.1 acyl-CoA dehydrogenase [Rhodococcus sp. OK611]SNX91956.1 acyl-CoA dehydrogenase [Rhodococcus sp. OK270]